MLEAVRDPEAWTRFRHEIARSRKDAPAPVARALAWLERTGAGDPARLRAEIQLLRLRAEGDRHVAAGKPFPEFEFADADPARDLAARWLRVLWKIVPKRRGVAHAVRLALRIAQRPGSQPGTLDELALAAPPHSWPVGLARREGGLTLTVRIPANHTTPGEGNPEINLDWPAGPVK
jgi:hypothetical protein